MKIQCYDKLGWPVELFYNRPVTNFIRRCLHTRGLRISIGTAVTQSALAARATGGVSQGPQADRARAQGLPAGAKAVPPLPADARMPWSKDRTEQSGIRGQKEPPIDDLMKGGGP